MTEKILQLNIEKKIFWSLSITLVLCIAFYIFFINATVRNVVSRQNLEAEASRLTVAIGEKEFEYISLRNAITLPLAYSLGFVEAGDKIYVSRTPKTLVSYNNSAY